MALPVFTEEPSADHHACLKGNGETFAVSSRGIRPAAAKSSPLFYSARRRCCVLRCRQAEPYAGIIGQWIVAVLYRVGANRTSHAAQKRTTEVWDAQVCREGRRSRMKSWGRRWGKQAGRMSYHGKTSGTRGPPARNSPTTCPPAKRHLVQRRMFFSPRRNAGRQQDEPGVAPPMKRRTHEK